MKNSSIDSSSKQDMLNAHLMKGECYLKLNKNHEAMASFNRVIEINPNYALVIAYYFMFTINLSSCLAYRYKNKTGCV
jgi:tetratricopeptide (TPR) repeat protein